MCLILPRTSLSKAALIPVPRVLVVATRRLRRKRYKIIEGNRRVLALKALETPSLVSTKLSEKQYRRLSGLSRRYAHAPIEEVACVLFDTEEEADHWIKLRHTGQNEGRGLMAWGAIEQDRYNSRRQGVRKPAGQVLEFVEEHGTERGVCGIDQAAAALMNMSVAASGEDTPEAREHVGLDLQRGQVIALYPKEEIAKTLTRIVEDAKNGDVTVPQLYHVQDRVNYVKQLPKSVLPKKTARLNESVLLDDLTQEKPVVRRSLRLPGHDQSLELRSFPQTLA